MAAITTLRRSILDNESGDHKFIAWLDQTSRRDVGEPGGEAALRS